MNEQGYMGATAPSATFQSTGTMLPSGSTYSSTPMIRQDGTAALYTTTEPAKANGPRRSGPGVPTTPGQGSQENQFPIGDALLPLLIFSCAYLIWRAVRRRALS